MNPASEKKRAWGEISGYKLYLMERNSDIRKKYSSGYTIDQLVDEGCSDGEFELSDGNHRLEAYTRLGITEYYVIIWITEKDEYDLFLSK